MSSSLNPQLAQIIAACRWGPANCLGFAADADTLLLESRASSTHELWQISSARVRGTLDLTRFAYCGTLPDYRGFILLEQGDTFSQPYHWDVDGTLSPIMAPLPTGRHLTFLPGGHRGIFADRQWQRALMGFPQGNLLTPLPELGLNHAAAGGILAYVAGTVVQLWSYDQRSLLLSLPIPNADVAMQYACYLDATGRNLLVEGRREANFVLFQWDIAGVLGGGTVPVATPIFASDHSDPFGIAAVAADGSTLIFPTEDALTNIPGRHRWERWDLRRRQALPCPQPQWPFRSVTVAPDDRTHLFYDAAGKLCFWSTDEPAEALTPPITAHEDADQLRLGFIGAKWSPDSRWLVTSGTNRRDELAALGYAPDDDALVSDEFKQRQRPAH